MPLSWPEFVLAVLVLLLTPGPTNTLLAVAGTERGLRRSLPLIPAEIGGYLLVIVPLATLAAEALAEAPALGFMVRIGAAAWVLFLAVRLWIAPPSPTATGAVTVARVFVTTALNPKALIFGLVLMPQGAPAELLPRLAAFAGLVVVVAATWIAFGTLLVHGAKGASPLLFRRVAAVFLLLFSGGIAGSAFGWL